MKKRILPILFVFLFASLFFGAKKAEASKIACGTTTSPASGITTDTQFKIVFDISKIPGGCDVQNVGLGNSPFPTCFTVDFYKSTDLNQTSLYSVPANTMTYTYTSNGATPAVTVRTLTHTKVEPTAGTWIYVVKKDGSPVCDDFSIKVVQPPPTLNGTNMQPIATAKGKCVDTNVDTGNGKVYSTYCAVNNTTNDPVVPGLTCPSTDGTSVSTFQKCYAAQSGECGENLPIKITPTTPGGSAFADGYMQFQNTYCSPGVHNGDQRYDKLSCPPYQACYISQNGICSQQTGNLNGETPTICSNTLGSSDPVSSSLSCGVGNGKCYYQVSLSVVNPNTNTFDLCNQIPDPTEQKACNKCNTDYGGSGNNPKAIWTAVGCIPTTPADIVGSIVRIALGIAGTAALLMILAGGFMLSVSQGEPKRVGDAKELVTAAVLGLLFIIFSVTILKFIGITIFVLPGFGGP